MQGSEVFCSPGSCIRHQLLPSGHTRGEDRVHYEKDHDHLGPWKGEVRILPQSSLMSKQNNIETTMTRKQRHPEAAALIFTAFLAALATA